MARLPVGTHVRIHAGRSWLQKWHELPCVVLDEASDEVRAAMDKSGPMIGRTWVRPLADRPDGQKRIIFNLTDDAFIADHGPIPDLTDRHAVDTWLDQPQREDA